MRLGKLLVGGILLLSPPTQALAETVLQCTEEASAGFHEQGGGYSPTSFSTDRFTVRLRNGSASLVEAGETKTRDYRCQSVEAGHVMCATVANRVLNINTDSGRFTRANGFGYAFSEEDSLTISYGTCASL